MVMLVPHGEGGKEGLIPSWTPKAKWQWGNRCDKQIIQQDLENEKVAGGLEESSLSPSSKKRECAKATQ